MKVKFFAQIRELTGVDELDCDLPVPATIDGLREQLMARGANWQHALQSDVLCARNQTLCEGTTPIDSDDEIAFFPPVTGG